MTLMRATASRPVTSRVCSSRARTNRWMSVPGTQPRAAVTVETESRSYRPEARTHPPLGAHLRHCSAPPRAFRGGLAPSLFATPLRGPRRRGPLLGEPKFSEAVGKMAACLLRPVSWSWIAGFLAPSGTRQMMGSAESDTETKVQIFVGTSEQ